MSKRIPEEEYGRKPLSKVIRWARGEADPYLGNVETHRQKKAVPNQRLVRKHKRDREAVIGMVLDQRRNRVIKGFRILYKVVSVVCSVALIIVFLWLASPVSSHLIARLEVVTNEHLEQDCQLPQEEWEDELC